MTSTIPARFIKAALALKAAIIPAPNAGNPRFFVLIGG